MLGYAAFEGDFRDISTGDLLMRLAFVLVHLSICAYPVLYMTRNNTQNIGLTIKRSLTSFKSDQQKRHYSTKKSKSMLVQATLKEKDLSIDFKHKTAVTGIQGTNITYNDIFKIIPIDTPKRENTTIFHNGLFAA
jgi:hypothetical protein